MSKERLKIIPGIYLVLIKDNKILLLRRYNTGNDDGNYSLVGGHVDDGEAYKDAMIREAKEEADIEINSIIGLVNLELQNPKNVMMLVGLI